MCHEYVIYVRDLSSVRLTYSLTDMSLVLSLNLSSVRWTSPASGQVVSPLLGPTSSFSCEVD